jgi:hypothetical protein
MFLAHLESAGVGMSLETFAPQALLSDD